eukprot:jgi/Antlo1/1820/953
MGAPHRYCSAEIDRQADNDIKKIYNVLMLCGLFMLLEVWGHWASNTLSLLADSIHLMADLFGFVVSLSALRWTKRKPSSRMTFGYGRVEILGALFSIFLIWCAVGYLIQESYYKYRHPHQINEKIFFIISAVGFIVNIICVMLLHDTHAGHAHNRNLNIRAAYVHVIGDLIQSTGVLIAGTITYFYPTLVVVDVVCTVVFSILVLFTTGMILKDGVQILLEMAPARVSCNEVKKRLEALENVCEVVDVKLWAICASITAANATLLVEDVCVSEYEAVLRAAKHVLQDELFFDFVTIQIETFGTHYESKVVCQGTISEDLLVVHTGN